jgi:outer membrane receptor protein involved in Fe transport
MSITNPMRATLAALLTSTMLASAPAFAQDAADDASGDEIIVTAQKRSENLQDVPISIQALGASRLENAQVSSFDDYQKLLPSVSSQSFGPSQAQVVFRGVTSGGDGLRIGPLPTSSIYVDEIPVTTIAGSVDVHVYDVARLEALAGPQGTLFGASSLSGVLRIITNKPDTKEFSGGVGAEVNKYGEGDFGGTLEGYVNLPFSDRAALRIVGFYKKEGGYIDNIPGTRTFTLDDGDPTTNLTVNNNALVEKNYNDSETYGGRIALGIELDDNWTITPQLLAQHQVSNGGFLFDPRKGDLKVTDYQPSRNKDRWYQAALTIEGKISNWDVVYSGGYFERKVNGQSDYSYYSVAYDTYGYYATYFPDGAGGFIDPSQNFIYGDKYSKQTHEFRVSTPTEKRFRLTAGLFYQRQTDNVRANYFTPGLGAAVARPNGNRWFPAVHSDANGIPDTAFLTRIKRVDRDYAIFGQAEFDLTDALTLTAGVRGFKYRNTIFGFSGFNFGSSLAACLPGVPAAFPGTPCTSVDKEAKGDGLTYKGNISWKAAEDVLLYATISKGFRPGGNNRRPGVNPFTSDTLTNYELGWKTTFGRVTFNGAAFYQEWKDLQFGLVPLNNNGITNTYNAGDARIYGLESDITYRSGGFTLTAAAAYIDAKLTSDFCQVDPVTQNIVCVAGTPPAAPSGTRLPVQPKFKGNVTARYQFDLGANTAFVQGSLLHQGGTRTFLTDADFAAVGPTSGFTTFDFSTGIDLGRWNVEAYIQNAFDKRGILTKNTFCATTFCGPFARNYPIKPQIFGLKVSTEF